MTLFQWLLLAFFAVCVVVILGLMWLFGGNEEGEYAHPSDERGI